MVVLFTPIDDIACFAYVVASGVIGLEPRGAIRLYLEWKPSDLKSLLGRCPTRKHTYKRGRSRFSSFGRPPPEYFEKDRARGTGLDAFCSVMDEFSE